MDNTTVMELVPNARLAVLLVPLLQTVPHAILLISSEILPVFPDAHLVNTLTTVPAVPAQNHAQPVNPSQHVDLAHRHSY